jgi:hypothetical protein
MPADEIRCRSYDDDWSALLDGELPPDRVAELSGHLAGCERCRVRVAALREVDALVAARAEPAFPADLGERLAARIRADAARAGGAGRGAPGGLAPTRRPRWLMPAAALAASTAAAALVLAVWPRAGTPPLVTPPPDTPPPGTSPPSDLAALPVEDMAVGLELETVEELDLEAPEDLDVIANLELLEAFLALEEDTG